MAHDVIADRYSSVKFRADDHSAIKEFADRHGVSILEMGSVLREMIESSPRKVVEACKSVRTKSLDAVPTS